MEHNDAIAVKIGYGITTLTANMAYYKGSAELLTDKQWYSDFGSCFIIHYSTFK